MPKRVRLPTSTVRGEREPVRPWRTVDSGGLDGAVGAGESLRRRNVPSGADSTRSFAALATEGTGLVIVFM